MKRVPENVHSIFDSFTISVITPQLLWVGIAGGNSGSIPGDDADVVSAKLKKKIRRDGKITREHRVGRRAQRQQRW